MRILLCCLLRQVRPVQVAGSKILFVLLLCSRVNGFLFVAPLFVRVCL